MSLNQPGDNKVTLVNVEVDPPTAIDVPVDLFRPTWGSFLWWDIKWNYVVPEEVEHVGRRDSKRKIAMKHVYVENLTMNKERLNHRYIQRPMKKSK